jgi:hypothetical protein
MEHRWSNLVVVLFWLSTMTWLMVEKVLPPLQRGDPPSFRSIYGELDSSSPPICWSMTWNDQPIGWAMSRSARSTSGMTEIHSRVHFSRIPLEEMAPVWMRAVVSNAATPLGNLQMDALSQMEIDPLNHLSGFRSSIRVARLPDAIVMQGTVEGTQLKLRVDAGDMSYSTERYLPEDALVGDELSPQAQMPGLHVGQTWTVPVYNPLRPPDSPMEILQATVEGHELIAWNGIGADALLVVYRSDPGSAFGTARMPRGKLWVGRKGTVLRQETSLFGSRLTFVRLSPDQSVELANGVDDTWPRPSPR